MNKTLKNLLWTGAGAAAVAAANNAVFAGADALGNTLGGDARFWPGPYGDLFYTKQGKGRPVVLLHGIYAGASGYEWRKNFDALSEHELVYAPDWLGFGLSDKPRIKYTAAQYVEQLTQFLAEVVKEPCTVIASSLATAYAVQVAADRPELIDRLILVCPTGFRHLAKAPDAGTEAIYQLTHAPLLGTTLHNSVTSYAGLRYYLMNQTYFDPSYVDDALLTHYFTASHQYGAQNAPAVVLQRLPQPQRRRHVPEADPEDTPDCLGPGSAADAAVRRRSIFSGEFPRGADRLRQKRPAAARRAGTGVQPPGDCDPL